MKFLRVLCLLTFFSPMLCAADPTITQEERAKAAQLLRDSKKEFLEATEKLTDAQWNYKPAPDKWSVAEIAEHIVLSENLLFAFVEKALAEKPNPEWSAKTANKNEMIERRLLNRDHKAQAPEQLKPQSKWTRAELVSRFEEARAKTMKFILETKASLKEHTVDHPFPIFGTLNAYQWVLYVPLHNMRHNKQIAEVKADPGFPK